MLSTLGPGLYGAMIGWSVYYFMRQYQAFNPRVLAGTVAAILGGPLLKFVGGAAGDEMQAGYLAGLGIGFFGYAIYLGGLLVLKHRGMIENVSDYEFYAGCGAGVTKGIDLLDLSHATRQWSQGKMTDKELKEVIQSMEMTQKDYAEMAKRLRADAAKAPKDRKAGLEEIVEDLDLIEKTGFDKQLAVSPDTLWQKRRRKNKAAIDSR